MRPGPRNLITDVAGLRVGHAQDAALKSGVTVLTADAPFIASVHVMGGAPGTRETDLLAPERTVAAVDALVLSGGSAFGLDACSGVVDALAAAGRGLAVGTARVPIVPGAILFDLLNGGDKAWAANPYGALGRAALEAAKSDFAIGSFGAGTGAVTARLKGGIGSASLSVAVEGDAPVTVGALVAANPVGAVTTPGDRHFWAAPFEVGEEFGGQGPNGAAGLVALQPSLKWASVTGGPQANTTIGIVATDARLTKAECARLAIAAHDGIARAIVPAHTPSDGDALFALSAGAVDADLALLCEMAAHCVARAIARAVYNATPAPGDILPCWSGATLPNAD